MIVTASPGQVLTPEAESGTEFLQTKKKEFCQSHVSRTAHGHMYEVGTLTRKGCHQVKKIKQFHLLEYTSFSSEVGLL